MKTKLLQTKDYLLLVDEEAEIKEGDIVAHNFGMGYEIEEPCDKDNLKSNTRFKIIAYYPLSKEAKELDLILLPNPFKDYSLDKAIEFTTSRFQKSFNKFPRGGKLSNEVIKDVIEASVHTGYKFASKANKQFTLDEMKKAIRMAQKGYDEFGESGFLRHVREHTETEIIQSLSTQQAYPKEFIPEYEYLICFECDGAGWMISCEKCDGYGIKKPPILKIITNSEGKDELVGVWVFEK